MPGWSVCICDLECDGTGIRRCRGCGGDECVCQCGGERECLGCDECDERTLVYPREATGE